jgi:hypothetical protein
MRKIASLSVVVVLLVLVVTACGSSRRAAPAQSQPKWVTDVAESVQRMFVGRPKPVSVSYYRRKKTVSVTLTFSRIVICGSCSAPSNALRPRGRRATITLDARTHRELSFAVLLH